VKKISTFKSQVEMYKKQIQELHEKMLNDEIRMKKLEFELKTTEELCRSLSNEKSRLEMELSSVGTGHGTRQRRSPTMDEPLSRSQSSPGMLLLFRIDDFCSCLYNFGCFFISSCE
jgi:hypothetical protein